MSTPLSITEDELNRFLEENNVNDKWQEIFHSDIDIKNSLFNIIKIIKGRYQEFVVPTLDKILRAFSRCSPEDIKVVILGHSPIPDKDLASGFSFSFPEGAWFSAPSITRLRRVLVEVGFLESGSSHDYCHEKWADKGVLLLNASLTLLNDTTGGQKVITDHFPLWETFIKHVLLHVARSSRQKPVFYLCWGTYANIVGNWLSDKLIAGQIHKCIICISDHPTYPREYNMYREQAVNQFRAIKCFYPDLFTLSETEHTDAGAEAIDVDELTAEEEMSLLQRQIAYLPTTFDNEFEYQIVILPKKIANLVPMTRQMSETEWRNIGVQLGEGWVHDPMDYSGHQMLFFMKILSIQ